ncbi:MAG: M48 family metalloprotease, partial [Elusimicrobia bacterium]|nr:M48 family metalloprotease [Elusimicrobiota bacterium]
GRSRTFKFHRDSEKEEKKFKVTDVRRVVSDIVDKNAVIRQPRGVTVEQVKQSVKDLAHSKDSFDRSLQLNQQQIKSLLLSYGLPESWIDEIDFNEGLPEDIVSLIKNSNSQITGTTIDENKSLIENLTNSPILFSLAIETFVRVYSSELNEESTLGDLLYCIEDRLNKKLYEATCVDLRGYFGEFYTANTLEAGIIFDKKVGPIIIRPNMPTESNIRGFDVYTIDGNKIQVKIGGSPIVWKHLQKYWKEVTPENEELGIINIPVITTKNVKNNSFPDDDRVQGLDITTEAVTTFAHEFVSALSGITYKKDMLSVSNIKLKDLINTFKGFYTDNPITFEQLIDLLTNKKQISGIQRDKTKKYTPQVIDFQRTINISDVSGQNIVVTDKTDKDKTDKDKNVHVIYVDETSISLNEKGRDELSDEQLSSYGIDAVEYDELGNIKTIFFNKDVEISVLKLDGDPVASRDNNIPFSNKEINALYSNTGTKEKVDIYLDGNIDHICHLIKKAATENKLIVIHMFKKSFKMSNLTPSQILELYKKVSKLISNRFQLSDIFPGTEDSSYTDYSLDFFFEEMLKNAFVYGNLGKLDEPLALHIELDKVNKEQIRAFSVYNKVEGKAKKETDDLYIPNQTKVLATSAHLIGDSKSSYIMGRNPIRTFRSEQIDINGVPFWKDTTRLRNVINITNYQNEIRYKTRKNNSEKTEETETLPQTLQMDSTVQQLYNIGFKKYLDEYLQQTGKLGKDLTEEEMLEIHRKAEKYRFTPLGLLQGVRIEYSPFWESNFVENHSFDASIEKNMKIAVSVMKILSIVIGISLALCSFSLLPVTAILIKAIISSILGIAVIKPSSAVIHFLWNLFAIITNNPELLLQTGRIIIPEEEKAEEKGRTLTEEEKENLKKAGTAQEDYYDSIYAYQPNETLQKVVEEVFGNLVTAMVSLGWITEEEKNQYQLHYYYQPTINAFTINNSKDVYLFSQLLFELDKKLQKEGKALTKDIVAAILAHELRHTIQEIRKYEQLDASRSKVINRGSDKRREYDADTGALEMLDMAGYNPKAMQELLTLFSKISGDSKLSSVFVLLDAHPNNEDRLKAVS